MPRPKLRTPELRERVLRSAEATLTEHGVAGFTTRRVAEGAETSVPAVYELFGDKAGLVRALFFEGFRRLGAAFDAFIATDDPRVDLEQVIAIYRRFARENALLVDIMFSRPFADFDPGSEELAAGNDMRRFIVAQVRRCIDAGVIAGDPTDASHVILALVQGMAAQESAGWLGRSKAAVERRWTTGVAAVLDGLAPPPAARRREAQPRDHLTGTDTGNRAEPVRGRRLPASPAPAPAPARGAPPGRSGRARR